MRDNETDLIDKKILTFLQGNGRVSNLELAVAIGLSPAQSQRRHRRLEDEGYISRYETRLNAEQLGFRVIAFVHVAMEKGHLRDLSKFSDLVASLPHVIECYSVTGDFDYMLKVVAPDLKALSDFLMKRLMSLPGIGSVRSSVCLDELKCTIALPLLD